MTKCGYIADLQIDVTYEDFLKGVFGGRGMEGMAMGRDGSTGDIRMGHDELMGEALAEVMGRTGGAGWIVEDRGIDSAGHLRTLRFSRDSGAYPRRNQRAPARKRAPAASAGAISEKSRVLFAQPENKFRPVFTGVS